MMHPENRTDAQKHRGREAYKQKKDKEFDVSSADTVVQQNAMVIETLDTVVASATVTYLWWFRIKSVTKLYWVTTGFALS